jgi:hypothetical protein
MAFDVRAAGQQQLHNLNVAAFRRADQRGAADGVRQMVAFRLVVGPALFGVDQIWPAL